MTKAKRFVRCFIAISLALLLLIAATVFVIDPLYQYHLPWFGLGMPLFIERYQNAGLARQLDYDAVLLGSSMVQNYRASWFDEGLGTKTLKLSYTSGYLPQYGMTLDFIYSLQDLDYVFLSLDIFALSYFTEYGYYGSPPYLYDNNRWNDVGYLFNRDVLTDVLPSYIEHLHDDVPLEDAFAHEDKLVFGRESAIAKYREWRDGRKPVETQLPRDTYKIVSANALTSLDALITGHPETMYYVFVPPYSILYWDELIWQGRAEAVLGSIDEAARILLSYDNVRFFCYTGMEDVITDLDRYADNLHFNRATCELVVSRMLAGEYEITPENQAAFMEALTAFVWNYDYEALFT